MSNGIAELPLKRTYPHDLELTKLDRELELAPSIRLYVQLDDIYCADWFKNSHIKNFTGICRGGRIDSVRVRFYYPHAWGDAWTDITPLTETNGYATASNGSKIIDNSLIREEIFAGGIDGYLGVEEENNLPIYDSMFYDIRDPNPPSPSDENYYGDTLDEDGISYPYGTIPSAWVEATVTPGATVYDDSIWGVEITLSQFFVPDDGDEDHHDRNPVWYPMEIQISGEEAEDNAVGTRIYIIEHCPHAFPTGEIYHTWNRIDGTYGGPYGYDNCASGKCCYNSGLNGGGGIASIVTDKTPNYDNAYSRSSDDNYRWYDFLNGDTEIISFDMPIFDISQVKAVYGSPGYAGGYCEPTDPNVVSYPIENITVEKNMLRSPDFMELPPYFDGGAHLNEWWEFNVVFDMSSYLFGTFDKLYWAMMDGAWYAAPGDRPKGRDNYTWCVICPDCVVDCLGAHFGHVDFAYPSLYREIISAWGMRCWSKGGLNLGFNTTDGYSGTNQEWITTQMIVSKPIDIFPGTIPALIEYARCGGSDGGRTIIYTVLDGGRYYKRTFQNYYDVQEVVTTNWKAKYGNWKFILLDFPVGGITPEVTALQNNLFVTFPRYVDGLPVGNGSLVDKEADGLHVYQLITIERVET